MCLIIQVPSGVEKSTPFFLNTVKEAFQKNPQGAGYAIKRGDNISFIKGFFNVSALLRGIEKENLNLEDELVVHFRIGNKGSINEKMCHPFVISSKTKLLERVSSPNVGSGVLFHNGTFKGFTYQQTLKNSDTFLFTKEFAGDEEILNFIKKSPESFEKLAKEVINGSRVLMMFPEHETVRLGDWYTEDGLVFSKNIRDSLEEYESASETHPDPSQLYRSRKRSFYSGTTRSSSSSYYNYYNEYEDYYDGPEDTGSESGTFVAELFPRSNCSIKQSSKRLPASSAVPETEKKLRLILTGNGLYYPKESGFIEPKMVPELSADLESNAPYIIIKDELYYEYMGLLIPYDTEDTEMYLPIISEDNKDAFTVYCTTVFQQESGGAVRGGQYKINVINSKSYSLTSITEGLPNCEVNYTDFYENFLICPTEDNENMLASITNMIHTLPLNYTTYYRLKTAIKQAEDKKARLVLYDRFNFCRVNVAKMFLQGLNDLFELQMEAASIKEDLEEDEEDIEEKVILDKHYIN